MNARRERVPAADELTSDECWHLLRSAEMGRIAVCIYERAHILPVACVVDDQSIVFEAAAGTTLAAAVLGREIAFEIDEREAFRLIGGRRSLAQLKALSWEGDPGPLLDLLSAYPLPAADLEL